MKTNKLVVLPDTLLRLSNLRTEGIVCSKDTPTRYHSDDSPRRFRPDTTNVANLPLIFETPLFYVTGNRLLKEEFKRAYQD